MAPSANDEAAMPRRRNPGASAPLPDLRISGFDIDKMMGAAGLVATSTPSPLGTTDDEDFSAGTQRDYITTKASNGRLRNVSVAPPEILLHICAPLTDLLNSTAFSLTSLCAPPLLRRRTRDQLQLHLAAHLHHPIDNLSLLDPCPSRFLAWLPHLSSRDHAMPTRWHLPCPTGCHDVQAPSAQTTCLAWPRLPPVEDRPPPQKATSPPIAHSGSIVLLHRGNIPAMALSSALRRAPHRNPTRHAHRQHREPG